jgi:hypothetical protein
MQQRTEVHIHIHEGASPAAVSAAVAAAVGSASGGVTSVSSETDDHVDTEKERSYWQRAYNESDGKAAPLIEFLVENPERLIPFSEVSEHLGFDNARSLAGLLGAFGRRAAHRYQAVWPFERKWVGDQWCLWMPQEAADVIRPLI